MLRYTTDRARPGLVALYSIRPGKGAGLLLEPGPRTGYKVTSHQNKRILRYARVCILTYHLRLPFFRRTNALKYCNIRLKNKVNKSL